MKNLNVNMVVQVEIKGRVVRFEDKEVGMKIYRNKAGNLEVQFKGQNLLAPNGDSEFSGCSIYPSGLVLKSMTGKNMVFRVTEECWFKLNGISEFHRAYLLGAILVSVHGECVKEYKIWRLPKISKAA